MAHTDLGAQQPAQKLAWGHKAYDEFQNQFFFTSMQGEGEENVIDHITELTNNEKGESGAMLHLVGDIRGGGVMGDNTLEGRERELTASWDKVNFDQLRNGFITKGRVSEQKSVLSARKLFRKKGARWLADTLEDQAVLTLSGISYAFNLDGSPRVTPAGQDPWTSLDYAADVTAPTANRHVRWNTVAGGFLAGDTTAMLATDVPTYAVIPELEALAANRHLTPLRYDGEEYFLWLVHTDIMAKLWRDADFRSIVVNGDFRGSKNKIFRGTKVTMNNIIIKPYNRIFNTKGAASSLKWGASGTVNGYRTLLLGAQALGMADLGAVGWEEEHKDYKSRWGLAIDKMVGFKKPRFLNSYTNTVEDYGVVAVDFGAP